ncbi:MAG TPA: hypothetical protein VLZ76_11135 [Lysobacter sp.]|nr:hypothetical protein [Lysobacter sp.]
MNKIQFPILATALAVVLSACAPAPTTSPEAASASEPSPSATPQDAFFDRLTALCGQAFAGEVEVDRPGSTGPNPFADQALVMHVRECSEQEIKIPFHVGEDRSRTWIVTRTADGLRLKHDHRLADGSDDPVTMYGGDTTAAGTSNRQEFPVDTFSQAMFTREGMQVSNTNAWAIEVEPAAHYTYELGRTDTDRLFRVRFDLTQPIDAPPAPWGAAD